jgi:hypothetical protein
MYKKIFSLLILVCFFSQLSFAQTETEQETEDRQAEFKEAAAEILGETSGMIPSLASPENRLSYTIRIAGMVWSLDETQARGMFAFAVEELKREITQIDGALNRMTNQPEIEWTNAGSFSDVRNKSNRVFQMRSTLINAVANHDAEWASRILGETSAIVTNPEFAKRFEQSDTGLKTAIAGKVARQDVNKALELGRERLSKGVSYDVTSLLQQIYNKDEAKGIAFGKEVVDKVKSSKDSISSWILLSILRQGSSNLQTVAKDKSGNRKPLFDDLTMRDLAGILADSMINSPSRRTSNQAMQYIEQYAPSKAALVKRAAEARANQNNSRRNATTGNGNGNNRSQSNSSWQKINEARSNAQKEITDSLKGLQDENVSDEDKIKLINETRSKILAVNNNNFRSTNLISLSRQASQAGQDELAGVLLSDAERFINLQPKERNDFTENRNLATAYTSVDPDKSFAILENMIFRLNDVIDGFIKVNEFSGNSRMVENGEMIMSGASRQFTTYLFINGNSLQDLAEADLKRLKNLGDKFTRPEFRVETRLMIAQNLLNPASVQENQNFRMRNFTRTGQNRER